MLRLHLTIILSNALAAPSHVQGQTTQIILDVTPLPGNFLKDRSLFYITRVDLLQSGSLTSRWTTCFRVPKDGQDQAICPNEGKPIRFSLLYHGPEAFQ